MEAINNDDYIKRPMNSFMIWSQEMRPSIIKSNPNVINSEISIMLGQLWLNMSKKQKEIYYKKAETLKLQHMELYPDYKNSLFNIRSCFYNCCMYRFEGTNGG